MQWLMDLKLNCENIDDKAIIDLCKAAKEEVQNLSIKFSEEQEFMFENHILELSKRIIEKKLIADIEKDLMIGVSENSLEKAKKIGEVMSNVGGYEVSESEVFLISTHIEIISQKEGGERVEKEILVVIGHRMGKGQAVAKGVEKAGGRAIVIPGMAADMKLGDIMHQENADIGISFCGSGGAGALTAQNKYGYKGTSSLRSIEAACTAINDGCKVIGLGFMDVEALGERVVETYREYSKKNKK